uniref:GDP-mannose 4,6-dehydratase n=1 Tax=Oncorhynchus mykiss TaxID=8022 RepID=A0A8C7SQR0_ONCMY
PLGARETQPRTVFQMAPYFLIMCGLIKSVKFYQASTIELYGKVHPFLPTLTFWEAYNLFAVNGILINHSNFLQWVNYVTRKISRSVAKVHLGQLESISLGNLHSKRDWDHAKDYAEEEEPEDLAIATGEVHSVREFMRSPVGKTIVWEGKDENEVGRCQSTALVNMNVHPKYYRPTEVGNLYNTAKQKQRHSPVPHSDL